jgi:hypothetical protein
MPGASDCCSQRKPGRSPSRETQPSPSSSARPLSIYSSTPPASTSPKSRARLLAQARERVAVAFSAAIATHAQARADELAHDHARVRAALPGVSRISVEPVLPVDVIGIFVLVPVGI